MRGTAGRTDALARNKAVGAVLVAGHVITAEQCDWLMRDAELTQERIEDAILYRSLVAELDLLKFLAAHYRTRFVSTERLSKAEIDRATLAMVPRQVAETFGVFPVMFDTATGALSVVTAEPDNAPVLKEIQSTSAARQIVAFVARPAAVRAAIAKAYAADPHAFAMLTQSVAFGGSSVVERARVAPPPPPPRKKADSALVLELDDGPIATVGRSSAPAIPPPRGTQGAPIAPPKPPPPAPPALSLQQRPPPAPPPAPAHAVTTAAAAAPQVAETPPTTPAPATYGAVMAPAPAQRAVGPAELSVHTRTTAVGLTPPTIVNASLTRTPSSLPPSSARATMAPGAGGGPRVDPEAVGELVNVLVALLDSARQDLRGHSSLVGRLVRRFGERLTLPANAVAALVLGAQLHDVGKSGPIHLTALNVAEYDSFKATALKVLMTPTRLLASANLPPDALEAVEQMYERYDGQGVPNGLSGKEISLGARIIAIADTYADLIENADNLFRRQLTPQEACAAIAKSKDTVFDPHLVDLFKSLVLGDDVRAKLLSNRHLALLVDPDAEETTVLELRLVDQGFEVKTVRTIEAAIKSLSDGDFDLVVSELEFGKGDGLALLKQVRGQAWGKDLPWIVYTRRQVRDDAQKAFDLGVLDFVAKPAQPDIFVAKLKALLDQQAGKKAVSGVSGSLKEMSLPDLVQILSQGRKTGLLRIFSGNDFGEIHFDGGALVNAMWRALKGEVAFYAMLKLPDGEFALDPQFKPGERVIHESAEGLLLEGLRRLDEGL